MGTRNRQRRMEKQRRRQRSDTNRRVTGTERRWERSAGPDPLQVRSAVFAAASAFRAGDEGDFSLLLAWLDRASTDDSGRMVADALDGCLADSVRAAWRRGWQPADLCRVTERKLGSPKARYLVDTVAADARATPPQAGSRWAFQVGALGADVWWTAGLPHLDQWARRHGMSRPEAVATGVELLSLLLHLPEIPRLCDPPGSGNPSRRGPRARTGAHADGRMLERVRALLAKAESTGFAEEAESLTAKAQELMARHSIDRAMLDAGAGGETTPTGARLAVDDPYAGPKAMLLAVVAEANRCRAVWSKDFGFTTVFGFEADVEGVEILYTSLLVQASTAMVATGSRPGADRRSRSRSFRHSFLVAYGERIGQRLREAQSSSEESAGHDYGQALVPVLAGRHAAVDDACDTAFPQMTQHSLSMNDWSGAAAGFAAAEMASLAAYPEVPAGSAVGGS